MQEVGMSHQHGAAGIPEDVGDLLRFEVPVDRDGVCAELHRGVGRLDEDDVVAHENANAIALLDADTLQAPRNARGAIGDFGMTALALAADDAEKEWRFMIHSPFSF